MTAGDWLAVGLLLGGGLLGSYLLHVFTYGRHSR